ESGPGYKLQGVMNTPLGEDLSMRGAVSYFDTDGHLENANTTDASAAHDVDPVRDLNARLSFLYEPTDKLSIELRVAGDLLKTRALYYVINNFGDPEFNDPNSTKRPINLNNSGVNDRDIYDAALKLTLDTSYGVWTSITGFNSVQE